jgi:hypothetical protein
LESPASELLFGCRDGQRVDILPNERRFVVVGKLDGVFFFVVVVRFRLVVGGAFLFRLEARWRRTPPR